MKLRSWILVAVLVLVAVFTLTACEGKCEHAYESEITAEATCTAEGKTTFTCSKCGDTYTESIAKTAHTYTETVEEATCIADGKKTYTCVCGDTYSETISAKGHSYTETVVAPTCTEEGYTLHACACGRTYTDTPVAAKGHSYTAKTTASTCAVNGNITYSCVCGHYYMEALPKADHTYTVTSVVAPTCLEGGYSNLLCSVCGQQTKGEFTTATGHKHTPVVTAPTCIAEGYTTHVCVCGDSYKDTPTPATGIHTYEKKIIALTDAEAAANPDAIAIEAMVCTGCGKVDETATGKAVLVYLNFDKQPTNDEVDAYEGSQGYQNYKGQMPDISSLAAAYLIDTQKHLDVITNNNSSNFLTSFGVSLQDGAMVTDKYTTFANDLKIGRKDGALTAFTISFDMTVKRSTPAAMFVIVSNLSPSNNRPITITAVAGNEGEVYLKLQSSVNGPTTLNVTTDYAIKIGEAYSYKLQMTGAPSYTVTLSVKKVSEEAYTNLGTYVYSPDTKAAPADAPEKAFTYFAFSHGSTSNPGAIVDNLLITSPLASTTCTEHNYVSAVSKAATCAKEGTRLYACLECGDSYSEKIPATGEHDYESVVTAPTCTEEGYTTHTCKVCGDSYTDTPVKETGHDYTSVEVPAGCVDGYFEYTCGVCGDKYTEPSGKPAVSEHAWELVDTVAPTCGAYGYFVYTCQNCGSTQNTTDADALPTGNHDYKVGIRALTEAEAALNPHAIGVEGSYCTVCGAADPDVTRTAYLVDLTFDETPTEAEIEEYEGSEGYAAYKDRAPSAASLAAAYLIDKQPHLEFLAKNKSSDYTTNVGVTQANGALTTGNFVLIANDLLLAHKSCKIPAYTISFDMTVKRTSPSYVFMMQSYVSPGNNRPIILNLSSDGNGGFFLKIESRLNGATKLNVVTDYSIQVGEAYSYKFEMTSAPTNSLTLYVKKASETAYTEVGTYTYTPDTKADTKTYFTFSFGSTTNPKAIVDNFKITTPFVTE